LSLISNNLFEKKKNVTWFLNCNILHKTKSTLLNNNKQTKMDGITQPNKKTILKFFFCCHMVSFLLEKKERKLKM